jgi:S1-C subfamily serine protease
MRLTIILAAAALLPVLVPRAGAEPLTADERARIKAAEAARCDAVERVYGSVVAVYRRNPGRGGGSGVVIHPDGWALTNYHVVRAAGKRGKAGLADGHLYPWQVYGMDPGGDLAVIRLAGDAPFPAAPLGDSDAVRAGDWALAMGNPFVLAEDQRPTVTLGIVSGVGRFQHGLGGRALVYGNCIQVDSSINPGNSGGPLFDADGRLIGINGRGSFEERGRVNVGLGYAISIEQARSFLPDLMASKLCRHGTLDATFTDAGDRVICDAVNTESPIGRRGLRPGDTLLAFDGRAVATANAFLNRISTYPAGWPVEVTFRRGDRPVSAWVRLTPLPYGRAMRPQTRVRPEPAPEPSPDEPDESEEEEAPEPDGADDGRVEKDEKDADTKEADAEPDIEPGAVMDADRNREACRWVLRQYVAFLGGRDALPPALTPLAEADPLEAFETVELEGGDRAARRRAFRLRVEPRDGPACVVWFSVFDERGAFEVRLLKVARPSEAETDGAAWTFGDYRRVDGRIVPHRVRRVRGLGERIEAEYTLTDGRPPEDLPDDLPGEAFLPLPAKTEAP